MKNKRIAQSRKLTENDLLDITRIVVKVVKEHTTDTGTAILCLRAAIIVFGGGLQSSPDER